MEGVFDSLKGKLGPSLQKNQSKIRQDGIPLSMLSTGKSHFVQLCHSVLYLLPSLGNHYSHSVSKMSRYSQPAACVKDSNQETAKTNILRKNAMTNDIMFYLLLRILWCRYQRNSFHMPKINIVTQHINVKHFPHILFLLVW